MPRSAGFLTLAITILLHGPAGMASQAPESVRPRRRTFRPHESIKLAYDDPNAWYVMGCVTAH
jgi:hypothetical protein